MGYSTDFELAVDTIDSSMAEVDFANKSFTKSEGSFAVDGVGVFSERATKNLSRWSGVPSGLMHEMSLPVANSVIQEQFIRRAYSRFRVGKNPTNPNEVIFIQPIQEPYMRYNDIFATLKGNIFSVTGNPITDDCIRVLTKNMEIHPNGEDMFVGQRIKVSNINLSKISSDFLTYRIICQNGLINQEHCQNYKISTENATPNFIADVIAARAKECDYYGVAMKAFVEAAVAKPVHDPVEVVCDQAEASRLIPKRVVKEARVKAMAIKEGGESFASAGINSLEYVWDWVNLWTFLCQSFTLFAVRENTEKGAFLWGKHRIEN